MKGLLAKIERITKIQNKTEAATPIEFRVINTLKK